LEAYDWPGNIRELENVIERAMVVSRGSTLELGEWFLPSEGKGDRAVTPLSLREMERQHILETLERTKWRVSGRGGAAELLELKPTTLESRMKKLGITRPQS
jgi:transcriptional regulator with GAF, ATPase, and Fis domain